MPAPPLAALARPALALTAPGRAGLVAIMSVANPAASAIADPLIAVRPRAPELCIVVPTFNERGNVAILVERLDRVLVLIDILAPSPQPLSTVELPYRFRARHSGSSKLDAFTALEYMLLLAEKVSRRFSPTGCCCLELSGRAVSSSTWRYCGCCSP